MLEKKDPVRDPFASDPETGELPMLDTDDWDEPFDTSPDWGYNTEGRFSILDHEN